MTSSERTSWSQRPPRQAGFGRDVVPFAVLTAFATMVFLVGGASRPDILPLLLLRPLSVAACGWALLTMPVGTIKQYSGLWWFATAMILLVVVQLVPLPPGIWQQLPGRAMVIESERLAGIGPLWRPISLTPDLTWNSLFALATPLATLLMVVALPWRWSQQICWVLIGGALISGLLGVMQIVGIVHDSLPYYDASRNAGAAVGLFANRNHAAVFLACLMPVLAAFAMGGGRSRPVVAGAIAAILIPLIIATGSRAGVLLGAGGVILAVALLLDERRRHAPRGRAAPRRWMIPAVAAAILIVLTALALAVPSAAWDRMLSSGSGSEKRLRAWPVVVQLAREQMPLGSGYGSFDPVFRAGEPLQLLSPTYFNHAHNDWLELWLTGGLPALALLAVGVAAWALATRRAWAANASMPESRLARAGSAVLLILALASFVDYPLRTPSLSMVAAIAVGWLAVGWHREAKRSVENSWPDDAGHVMREADV